MDTDKLVIDIQKVIDHIKEAPSDPRSGRRTSLVITKLQEAQLWLRSEEVGVC